MKFLFANKYFFRKGGAETAFFDGARLLQEHGHQVCLFSMDHPHNRPSQFSKYFVSHVDYERGGSLIDHCKAACRILYSFEAKRKLGSLLDREKPDVAHIHNIYHQISPSILHTLKKRSIPVVMTLYDYKMVCPVYHMMADGKPCEQCRRGRYYWCLINRCTKNSYAKSALNVIEMYLHHKLLHIHELVDVFIAPSRFLKIKVEEMGFQGDIRYLPYFIWADEFIPTFGYKERSIYYAGRLVKEKGLFTLLEAVKGLDIQLKIIGEGPLMSDLAKHKGDNTDFLGYMPLEELKKATADCMGMVISSEWYENNPLSIMEAFALGKPVIGPKIGSIPELIKEGENGLTFEPGNAHDLREKIEQFTSMPLPKIQSMGRTARYFVEREFSPHTHYQGLMRIYQMAMERHK